MANTYTSNTLSVSDGQITEHDTSKDGEINILSAECRWQGVNVSTTSTTTDCYSNYNDYKDENMGGTTTYTQSGSIPSMSSSGEDFEGYEYSLSIQNETTTSFDVDVSVSFVNKSASYSVSNLTIPGTSGKTIYSYGSMDTSCDVTIDGDEYVDWPPQDSSYIGEEFELTITHSSGGTIPSSTDIEGHTITTYATATSTTTTTYHTEDPFVTRDVDGSYTGTLNDGEWSPWVTLNGLAANQNNEFYHNISGSNEAYYEFTYDWEYAYPDAKKQLRIYDEDQNTIHKVALADPSDSQLDYNAIRVALNGTVYAVDVVDPSDSSALDWTHIYHGTHGELALRAYDTIQL